MTIRYEHRELVGTPPDVAFAVIDNLPATARWLPPCVSLAKLGDGPNAPGDTLHYVYTQGGRQAEMTGTIIERVPGRRLWCRYSDRAFTVDVDMRVDAAPGGALTTHVIEITPHTFGGRLMSPLIRLGLRKQTRDAAANLRRLLESGI